MDNSSLLQSPLQTTPISSCHHCTPWIHWTVDNPSSVTTVHHEWIKTINNPSLVTTVHHKCIELLTTPICSNHQCKPWIHWTANNPSRPQTYHCTYTTSLLSHESDPVSPMPCCNRVPRTQDLESPLQRIQNCQRIPTLSGCPVVCFCPRCMTMSLRGFPPCLCVQLSMFLSTVHDHEPQRFPTVSVCPVVYVFVHGAWPWASEVSHLVCVSSCLCLCPRCMTMSLRGFPPCLCVQLSMFLSRMHGHGVMWKRHFGLLFSKSDSLLNLLTLTDSSLLWISWTVSFFALIFASCRLLVVLTGQDSVQNYFVAHIRNLTDWC